MVAYFVESEGCTQVRRWSLRLISLLSLGVYLLANTPASFALDDWLSRQIHENAASATATTDNTTPRARFCKGCKRVCKKSSGEEAPNRPCRPSKSSPRPCCPNEKGPTDCPCPGGCALCSVAKAPCLTPLAAPFDHAVCIGACCVDEPFDYVSPLQFGLIRPPRI